MGIAKHQLNSFFSRVGFPICVEDVKVLRYGSVVGALRISVPAIEYARDWTTESRSWVSHSSNALSGASRPNVTSVRASGPIQWLGASIVGEILATAQNKFILAANASTETPAMAYVQACVTFLNTTLPQQLTGPFAAGISAYGASEVQKHYYPFMHWFDSWVAESNDGEVVSTGNSSANSRVLESPRTVVATGAMSYEHFKDALGSSYARDMLGYTMNQAEANWILASDTNTHAYFVKWLADPKTLEPTKARRSQISSPTSLQTAGVSPHPQPLNSPSAVGGFTLTILGLLFVTIPIVSLPLSIIGLVLSVRVKNKIPFGTSGRGLAVAGVTIGIVAVSLTSLLMLIAVPGALQNNF